MDFWAVHGTLLLSGIAYSGLFWWLGLIFVPRLLVAILVTTKKFQNNPEGRILRFLWQKPNETDDPYTMAPFIVKYIKELTELAKPQKTDSEVHV